MTARTAISLCVAFIGLAFCPELQSGHRCSVKAKASQHQRLAPELDLLRRSGGRFLGVCRHGQAVFDIPQELEQRVQSLSTRVEADAPQVEAKGKRLIIKYASRDHKPAQATLTAGGLRLIEDYERGSFYVVEPEDAVSPETVEALLADDAVEHAAPDYIVSALPVATAAITPPNATQWTPNDPLFGQLWGMQNIGTLDAWQTIRTAHNIVVAVIDTGVDYRHPDLKANMWSKNGRYGYDFYDNDADPLDEQDHGTHCAGTIAGVGDNGVGVTGVCWNTRIMALRFLGPDGSGSTADAVKCIDWAVANGAHILSNSWSGPDTSPALAEAITRAEQKGVLFIAAAGNTEGGHNNDTAPYYPASHANANIITVAAIGNGDVAGSFTHYGRQSVDIGAPGVGIVSTIRNGRYAKLDGTSMAAPHVAGAAALIWAKAFASPAQDRTQMTTVRDLIYANARPVPSLKNYWGYASPAKIPGGVLDISFLMDDPATPPSTIQPRSGRRTFIERRMIVDPWVLR